MAAELTRSEKLRRAADYRRHRDATGTEWTPTDEALAYAMWDAAWERHQAIYEAAARMLDEANRERAALRAVLRAFVDDEPCRYNASGGCVRHPGTSAHCDVARARELLGLEPIR